MAIVFNQTFNWTFNQDGQWSLIKMINGFNQVEHLMKMTNVF
jgi:hypothetical protein